MSRFRPGTTDLQRIEGRHTVMLSGCWHWNGAPNSNGYGTIKIRGRTRGAHRLSYELRVGPVPPGFEVCHSCDNPICVNPGHLFVGTHDANMADMRAKGRAGDQRHPESFREQVRAAALRRDPSCYLRGEESSSRRFPERLKRGSQRADAKLTEEKVALIRAAVGPQREIAGRFGVTQSLISLVKQKRIWRHVP